MNQLITDIAEAIYQTFLEARRKPQDGLRFNGRLISTTDVPIHIQSAILLKKYFCSYNTWKDQNAIVALVAQAVNDLNKEIAINKSNIGFVLRDEKQDEVLEELVELREYLQEWLDK